MPACDVLCRAESAVRVAVDDFCAGGRVDVAGRIAAFGYVFNFRFRLFAAEPSSFGDHHRHFFARHFVVQAEAFLRNDDAVFS